MGAPQEEAEDARTGDIVGNPDRSLLISHGRLWPERHSRMAKQNLKILLHARPRGTAWQANLVALILVGRKV